VPCRALTATGAPVLEQVEANHRRGRRPALRRTRGTSHPASTSAAHFLRASSTASICACARPEASGQQEHQPSGLPHHGGQASRSQCCNRYPVLQQLRWLGY
jgi:hypothetical protein